MEAESSGQDGPPPAGPRVAAPLAPMRIQENPQARRNAIGKSGRVCRPQAVLKRCTRISKSQGVRKAEGDAAEQDCLCEVAVPLSPIKLSLLGVEADPPRPGCQREYREAPDSGKRLRPQIKGVPHPQSLRLGRESAGDLFGEEAAAAADECLQGPQLAQRLAPARAARLPEACRLAEVWRAPLVDAQDRG